MRHLIAFSLLSMCKPHVVIPKKVLVIDAPAQKHALVIKVVVDEYNTQNPTPILEVIDREPLPDEWVVHVTTTLEGWDKGKCGARINGDTINLCSTINPWWSELPNVLTHEIGHSLCICHSNDPNSIMYKSTQKTEHTLQSSVADVLYLIYQGGNCPDGPMSWDDPNCKYLSGQNLHSVGSP